MYIKIGVALTTRIVAIEYGEHVSGFVARMAESPFARCLYVVIFVCWVGLLQLRGQYDPNRANQSHIWRIVWLWQLDVAIWQPRWRVIARPSKMTRSTRRGDLGGVFDYFPVCWYFRCPSSVSIHPGNRFDAQLLSGMCVLRNSGLF
jgi:hypothetical protein